MVWELDVDGVLVDLDPALGQIARGQPLGTQTSPPGRSRSKAPFAATKPPDSVPNRQ